jgi:multidrug efflux pump subunit AcrA (membrane-fusion protein)
MTDPALPFDPESAAAKPAPLAAREQAAAGPLGFAAGDLIPIQEVTLDDFLPPLSPLLRWAGVLMVASFLGSVGLMAIWPYRVVVRGQGSLRPQGETTVINAPFSGRVQRIAVRPDQMLSRGQLLAELDPIDLLGRRNQLKESQVALTRQAEALRLEAGSKARETRLDVGKNQAALQLAESEYRRYQQLVSSGATSRSQLDEKLASFQVASRELAKAREAIDAQTMRSRAELAQQSRQLADARAELGQVGRELGRTALRSPVAGVVLSLGLRNPQQIVATGQELMRIAPSHGALEVKVIVPGEKIDAVQKGQRADLRISACPYPDFGTMRAQVVSIAPDSVRAPQQAGDATTAGRGYEVTLVPAQQQLRVRGRSCQLRQGMDLSADITTRKETVLRFLLRQARLTVGL